MGYKEGMKCTQEKARNRPKMKEVYEELLRCEIHSPTPYELQQQFDSAEKNPPGTKINNSRTSFETRSTNRAAPETESCPTSALGNFTDSPSLRSSRLNSSK